jgi:uncharacterized repeat protein (TIGR02543 family)
VTFRPAARADPTTIFSDGFESGDFGAWTGSGGATVQSTTVHNGTYAAMTSSGADYFSKDFAQVNTIYARAYVRWDTNPAVGNWFYLFVLSEGPGEVRNCLILHVVNDGGTIKWQVVGIRKDGAVITETFNSSSPTVNTWYCVELEWHRDTESGASLYVDGSLLGSVPGVSCDYPAGNLYFDSWDKFPSGGHIFFDDVVLADSYVGPFYQVTFDQSGSGAALNVTYSIDGGSSATDAVPFNVSVDAGSAISYSYDSTVPGSSGTKYVLIDTSPSSPQTISGALEVMGTYKTQYYLTVSDGGHGTAGGQGWYDANVNAQATMTPLTVPGTTGTQYVFAGWSGDASGSGSPSNNILMDAAKTATATWTTQYYLTVDSVYDTPGGAGWYDSGSTVCATLTDGTVSGGAGTRYVFTSWSTDASGTNYVQSDAITMSGPKTALANWKTQFQVSFSETGLGSDAGSNTVLTVGTTAYAYADFPVNNIWVDSGTTFIWSTTVSGGAGKRFVETGDSGLTSPITASGTSSNDYKTQYELTMATDFGSTTPSVGGGIWYDADSTVTIEATAPSAGAGERYVWNGWTGSGTGSYTGADNPATDAVTINGPITETASWTHQYELTVTSTYDTAGGAGWYDSGSTAYATLTDGTVSGGTGTQYVFTGWGGDASGSGLTSDAITMNGPRTATAVWKTRYYLTVETSPSGVNGPAGEGWYDGGVTAYVGTGQYVDIVPGNSRYRFDSWTSASGTYSDATVTMDSAKTATANYVTQYYVIFAESGVDTDFTGTVMTIGGTGYNRDGHSDWYDNGASITFSFDSPLVVTANVKQYVLTGTSDTSPLTVSGSVTVTGTYKTQWYITVTSAHGSPTASSGWVDDGFAFSVSVTNPDVVVVNEHRWNLTGLKIDGVPQTLADSETLTGVNAAHSIEFDWTEQFYLTVTSVYDTPGGAGWYDSGSTAYATLTDGTVPGTSGTRYVFTSWGGDASGANYVQSDAITMNGPRTATASWTTQYNVTFAVSGLDGTATGTVLVTNGSSTVTFLNFTDFPYSVWVNSSDKVSYNYQVFVLSTVSDQRFRFTFASGPAAPITVTGPVTVTGNYDFQYHITFAESGVDTDFTGTVMTVGGTDYNRNGHSDWYDNGASIVYSYASPLTVDAGKCYFKTSTDASPLTVSGATTVTGTYKTQWYITVNANGHGSPTQASQWVDAGSSFSVSVSSPDGDASHQFVVVGSRTQSIADVESAQTLTFTWTEQWYITVTSAHGSPTASSGWVDDGFAFSVSVTNPDVVVAFDHQWSLTGLLVDSSPQALSDTVSYASVHASHTIEFDWTEQYYLTVSTSPSSVNSPTGEGWYDTGVTAHVSTDQYVDIVSLSSRYRFDSWTGASGTYSDATVTMDSAKTATANYVTQYYVAFAQSGVSVDFSGDVMSVEGVNYTRAGHSDWYDSGASVSFSFYSPLTVDSGKKYVLASADASSPLSVSAAQTVTGTYKTQYLVTFAQSGVDVDFSGNVMNVSNVNYTRSGFSAWFDSGANVPFNYYSPLVVNATNQYVWGSTSGLSTLQSGSLTITASGSVVGNYALQNAITFDESGLNTDFTGTVLLVDGTPYSVADLPVSFSWETGSTHTFAFQSPLTVTANAKRYVWTSTSGLSTVQGDSITVTTYGSIVGHYTTQYKVTFDASSNAKADGSGTIVTVGGVAKTAGDLPFTADWIDSGQSVTWAYSSPVTSTSSPTNTQYRWDFTTGLGQSGQSGSLTVTGSGTVTGNYVNQYYLTVNSVHDTPGGMGWYDSGSTAYATLTDGIVAGTAGTQYVFTSWSGDASGTNYAQSDAITMNSPKTATAVWKTRYFLTVTSAYGTTSGSGWYDSGLKANVGLSIGSIDHLNGTQHVFVNWGGDATGTIYSKSNDITMDGPKTALAVWKTQYKLTVSTNFGTALPSVGDHWYDAGSTVTIQATAPSAGAGERYVWNGWTGSGTISYTGTDNPATDAVTMNSPITETASWTHQYYLTVDDGGHGTAGSEGWYDANVNAQATMAPLTVAGAPGTQYVFAGWSGDASGSGSPSNNILMDAPKTATATWTTQYYLTFAQSGVGVDLSGNVMTINAVNYDSAGHADWYDNGAIISFSFYSPLVVTVDGKQYVLTGVDASSPLTVSAATTVTGTYKTQWYVSVSSAHDTATASGWVDSGGSFTASVTSPADIVANDHQWVCTGYRIDSGLLTAGTSYTFTSVASAHTIEFDWNEQFYLTVTSAYDTAGGAGWYDTGSAAYATLTDGTVPGTSGIQYVFASWGTDASGTNYAQSNAITMSGPKTALANWKTRYELTMAASFGTTSPSVGGSHWYDVGSTVTIEATAPSAGAGERYVWNGWTGSGTGSYTGMDNPATDAVTINGPITETASWTHQYYVTFAQSGVGADFTGTVMTVGGTGYSRDGHLDWYDSGAGITFSFDSPLVVTANVKQYVLTGTSDVSPLTVSGSVTVTGTYKTQYYISVTSLHGNPTASSGWINDGDAFSVSVTNPDVIVTFDHQWNLTGLTVDSSPQTISDTVDLGTVHASHTIEFDWTEQYYLTVVTSPPSVNSPTGQGWYDTGVTAHVSTDQYVDIVSGSSRYRFDSWTGASGTYSDATVVMDAAKTATANYVEQYHLTVSSLYDSPGGAGWYDSGSTAYATLASGTVSGGAGTQYVFIRWGTDASGTDYAQSNAITMDGPKTATSDWKTQYQVSFVVTPSGSGSTTPAGTNVWQDAGSLSISALANPGYMFSNWSSDTGSITFGNAAYASTTATIGEPGTITANFAVANATLVVRGESNVIWYRFFNTTSQVWSDWTAVPDGATGDSPAAAVIGNTLQIVVRGINDDQIWHGYVNLTDDTFSGWTLLSGATPSAPTLTTNGTSLCLVVRGESDIIWYRFYDISSKVWSDWTALPEGATGDSPAATLLNDTLQVVVRGVNGDQIWHSYVNLTDDTFSGWTLLSGATPSAPTLTTNGTSLCLVVRGETNCIYYRFYDVASHTWSDWTALPDGTTNDSPAATLLNDTLQVVVRGVNNDEIWHGYVNLTDNTFSGWTLLSGATPSKPTLTS